MQEDFERVVHFNVWHFPSEGKCFANNAMDLQKNEFRIFGRLTAMSLICGHPGPKNLNQTIVDYILGQTEDVPKCPKGEVDNGLAQVTSAMEK